jgi:hypothetical protein
MWKRTLRPYCLALALAASGGSHAGPQVQDDDSLAAADQIYGQERKRIIADNLQLTPDEAKRFWPVYEAFERDLNVLTERRRAIIARFGENYDAMTDDMARQILRDRLQLEESRAALKQKFMPRFERALPIKKLARYYQIESKIYASVEAGIADELPLLK